jgi:hypothetical protein
MDHDAPVSVITMGEMPPTRRYSARRRTIRVKPGYLQARHVERGLRLGVDLIIAVRELVGGFRAISEAGAALAVATSALL